MIKRFKEIISTNDYVKEHLNKMDNWDVIIADIQQKGRGRYKRQWYSPKGGLWFSTVFTPDFTSKNYPLIPIITGISVVESLKEFDVQAGLKWPNDIILNGKKIGGILSEYVKEKIIIGIGINLNFKNELFNEDLRLTATTIFSESGKKIHKVKLLKIIIKEIRKKTQSINEERKKIKELWENFDAFVGKDIEFIVGDKKYRGKECGIDNDGKLIIRIGEERFKFISGEIKTIRG